MNPRKKRTQINFILSMVVALSAFVFFVWFGNHNQESENNSAKVSDRASTQSDSFIAVSRDRMFLPSSDAPGKLSGQKDAHKEIDSVRGEALEKKEQPRPVSIPEGLPEDLVRALTEPPPELPPDFQAQLNAPPPPLPEDMEQQLRSPPPPLPPDLQEQLNSEPPELPDDIKRALKSPAQVMALDESLPASR